MPDLQFDSMCKEVLASNTEFVNKFEPNLRTCSFRKSDIPAEVLRKINKLVSPAGKDGLYRTPTAEYVRLSSGRFASRETVKGTLMGRYALLREQEQLEAIAKAC